MDSSVWDVLICVCGCALGAKDAQVCVNLCPQSVSRSSGETESEGVLPQLPLPCLNSAQTRVFFGHERRLAEGESVHV